MAALDCGPQESPAASQDSCCLQRFSQIARLSAVQFRFVTRRQPFLSHALSGQDIALEEVEDGIWNIVYYQTLLGRIDERTARIAGITVRA